jgi:hypothetical protein
MDYKDFIKAQMENLKEIKKSLYRDVASKQKQAKDAIVADIADPDNVAEVPDKMEPVQSSHVMNKSKESKGVHKPYMSQGESFAGEIARQGSKENNPTKKDMARKLHSQKSKEIKNIKPNLPKSEMAKSEKALHEMTRKEYDEKYGKSKKKSTVTGGFHPHESAVETAINQGKKVADHVLADYPHLKPMGKKDSPCWEGYKKVAGKKDYEKGSCMKKGLGSLKEFLGKTEQKQAFKKKGDRVLHPQHGAGTVMEHHGNGKYTVNFDESFAKKQGPKIINHTDLKNKS